MTEKTKRDVHVSLTTTTVAALDAKAKQMRDSGSGKVNRSDVMQMIFDEYFAKASLKIQ